MKVKPWQPVFLDEADRKPAGWMTGYVDSRASSFYWHKQESADIGILRRGQDPAPLPAAKSMLRTTRYHSTGEAVRPVDCWIAAKGVPDDARFYRPSGSRRIYGRC